MVSSNGYTIPFLLSYLLLFLTSFAIFRIYVLQEGHFPYLLGFLYFVSLVVFVATFPRLGHDLLAFVQYLALVVPIACFVPVIGTRIFGEVVISAKDYLRGEPEKTQLGSKIQIEDLLERGMAHEAILVLKDVLTKDPRRVQIHLELADIYAFYFNDYTSALEQYIAVLNKTRDERMSVSALFRIADIYATQFEAPESAIRALQKVIEGWPKSEHARHAMERISRLSSGGGDDLGGRPT